jgi:hypothetical protein
MCKLYLQIANQAGQKVAETVRRGGYGAGFRCSGNSPERFRQPRLGMQKAVPNQ